MTDTHGTYVLDTETGAVTETTSITETAFPDPDTFGKNPRFTATYRCTDGTQISVADAPDGSTTLTVSVTGAAEDDHFVKVSLTSADGYRVRSMLYNADDAGEDARNGRKV